VAQTKKRRRKKHRGTQAGTIDRRGRTSRPMNRSEARAQYKAQRTDRMLREPSWRSAANRGAIAAALFLIVLVTLMRQPVGASIGLAGFMLLIYIPMGYLVDSFFYKRRSRRAG